MSGKHNQVVATTGFSHPLQRIIAIEKQSSDRFRKLSSYILNHVSQVPALTIADLAAKTGVSKSTIVRFCQLLGYDGYREFRMAMAENRAVLRGAELLGSDVPDDAAKDESLYSIARKVIQINTEVLLDTLNLFNEEAMTLAITYISGAAHVHLVGMGSSAPVAQDAYQRLIRLGIRASVYSDPHIAVNAVTHADEQDVVFGISYTGASRDVVETLSMAQERNLTTIALTSHRDSPVTRAADTVLLSSVRRAPIPAETVASRISQLAVVDILCVGIGLQGNSNLIEGAELLEYELSKKRLQRDQYE